LAGRYALIVASSRYDDGRLSQLRAPATDADGMGVVLSDPLIGGYELTSLIDQPAHLISERIEGFYRNRTKDDLLLLYFSCHGVKNDHGRLHFATTNTRLDRLASTSVSSAFITELLDDCMARSKILILDCCYSGAFVRGMRSRAGEQVTLDDFAGSGRAIITASSATEYSYEIDELDVQGTAQPSVFTKAIVHGLTTGEADRDGDGQVSVDDLYEHVSVQVRHITPSQTPGKFVDVYGPIFVARSASSQFGLGLLSREIRSALSSPLVGVRKGIVEHLAPLLEDQEQTIREAARAALTQLTKDDSDRVVTAAVEALRGEERRPMNPELESWRELIRDRRRIAVADVEDTVVAVQGQHGSHGEAEAKPKDQGSIVRGHPPWMRDLRMNSPAKWDPDASPAAVAEWAEMVQFSTTRARPGYDQEEVDKFVDAIRDTFLGVKDQPITATEVRNVQFRTTRLRPGYDEEEVDAFLDEAELRLAGLPRTWPGP
jgi:DivIVA domain-containing protein